MSTGNFYNKNASKIYAGLMNYEDDEAGENGDETVTRSCDEDDVQMLSDYIDELCEELKKNKKYNYYPDGKSWDNNRNFEGRIMGEVSVSKDFGDIGVDVSLQMIMRSGYYEGGNLDWELTILVAGSGEYDEEGLTDKAIAEDFEYNSRMPKGMQVIQARNAIKWVMGAKDLLIRDVEEIFTKVSMPLVVTARFSNGETMYAKADSIEGIVKS